jgi:hypothetical protein
MCSMSLLNLLKRCARKLTRVIVSSKLLYLRGFFPWMENILLLFLFIRIFHRKMQLWNKIYFHVINVILHNMKDKALFFAHWVNECNISTFSRIFFKKISIFLEWKFSLKKEIKIVRGSWTEGYFYWSHCGNTKRGKSMAKSRQQRSWPRCKFT